MSIRRLPTIDNGIDPTKHLGLVRMWAFHYRAKRPVEDSEQYADGLIGLMRAARCFDPAKGFQFSTYASNWIRQAICRRKQLLQTEKRGNGKIKTFVMSQIQPHHDRSGRPDIQFAVDGEPFVPDQVIDRSEQSEARRICNELLRYLVPRQRRFVERWYMDGMTLEQIADLENPPVTRERVRQLLRAGMRALQHHAQRKQLEYQIPTMELFER